MFIYSVRNLHVAGAIAASRSIKKLLRFRTLHCNKNTSLDKVFSKRGEFEQRVDVAEDFGDIRGKRSAGCGGG
jgi:hypothetical protein